MDLSSDFIHLRAVATTAAVYRATKIDKSVY